MPANGVNCYGSRNFALPALDRWILATLKDAKGFFKVEGLHASDLEQHAARMIAKASGSLQCFTRQQIGLGLARLARRRRITRGTRGWRVA